MIVLPDALMSAERARELLSGMDIETTSWSATGRTLQQAVYQGMLVALASDDRDAAVRKWRETVNASLTSVDQPAVGEGDLADVIRAALAAAESADAAGSKDATAVASLSLPNWRDVLGDVGEVASDAVDVVKDVADVVTGSGIDLVTDVKDAVVDKVDAVVDGAASAGARRATGNVVMMAVGLAVVGGVLALAMD